MLNYRIFGQGKPVILVHGWGGSILSLYKLAGYLSSRYKVIIIDLPGFGLSQKPNRDWGVEEYSKVIVALLKKLEIKKTAYFGHSFGGSLGIFISAHYPQLIDKLILCNSSFKRNKIKTILPPKLKKILENNYFLNKFFLFIRMLIYKILFRKSDLLKYPQLEPVFKKLMAEDLTPLLKKIKIPTLILWGEKDMVTPIGYAYELHKKIVNSSLKIIPQATHGLPLTQPKLVFEELNKFL